MQLLGIQTREAGNFFASHDGATLFAGIALEHDFLTSNRQIVSGLLGGRGHGNLGEFLRSFLDEFEGTFKLSVGSLLLRYFGGLGDFGEQLLVLGGFDLQGGEQLGGGGVVVIGLLLGSSGGFLVGHLLGGGSGGFLSGLFLGFGGGKDVVY